MREFIKNQILDFAEVRGLTLTEEELRSATSGVEYYISEVLPDSIDTALNDVQFNREQRDLKEYIVSVDTMVSVKAKDEDEATFLAKYKFADIISNNEVDYIVEEEN